MVNLKYGYTEYVTKMYPDNGKWMLYNWISENILLYNIHFASIAKYPVLLYSILYCDLLLI